MDAILPHKELTVVSLFLPVPVLKNQDKQGMFAAGKCWAGLVWMEVYPGNPWAPCPVFCLSGFQSSVYTQPLLTLWEHQQVLTHLRKPASSSLLRMMIHLNDS